MQSDLPSSLQPVVTGALNAWEGLLQRTPFLLAAVLVLVAGWWLSRPVGRMLCRVERGHSSRQNLAEALSRLARAALIALTVLVAAVIAFPTFKPGDLVAGLGI